CRSEKDAQARPHLQRPRPRRPRPAGRPLWRGRLPLRAVIGRALFLMDAQEGVLEPAEEVELLAPAVELRPPARPTPEAAEQLARHDEGEGVVTGVSRDLQTPRRLNPLLIGVQLGVETGAARFPFDPGLRRALPQQLLRDGEWLADGDRHLDLPEGVHHEVAVT